MLLQEVFARARSAVHSSRLPPPNNLLQPVPQDPHQRLDGRQRQCLPAALCLRANSVTERILTVRSVYGILIMLNCQDFSFGNYNSRVCCCVTTPKVHLLLGTNACRPE
jgi:hypothetical protein